MTFPTTAAASISPVVVMVEVVVMAVHVKFTCMCLVVDVAVFDLTVIVDV